MAALVTALAAGSGCASSASEPGGTGGSTAATPDAGTGEGGTLTEVRGVRYCEILLGKLEGTMVHVDVYNTTGLDDCPEAAWAAIDPTKLKTEEQVDIVILNGPRYWEVDEFVDSSFVEPTPRTFGGIQMRLAGTLDLTLAEAMAGQTPYASRNVARTTTWMYEAGKPVYELVDAAGHIYDMQSYSVQKKAQTEASLAALGAALTLPAGWTFRTRTLTAPLSVTAVNGLATVVQDDFENTYQLSQQAP